MTRFTNGLRISIIIVEFYDGRILIALVSISCKNPSTPMAAPIKSITLLVGGQHFSNVR